MSVFTWLWIGWGVAFCVVEGVALVNSRGGDTLSEHVWAFMGIRRSGQPTPARTPRWTLRVARIVVLSGLLW
ncbi:MAG TPA: hypothetical protein VIQ30_25915, partial [Pseudonocardia sp.]